MSGEVPSMDHGIGNGWCIYNCRGKRRVQGPTSEPGTKTGRGTWKRAIVQRVHLKKYVGNAVKGWWRDKDVVHGGGKSDLKKTNTRLRMTKEYVDSNGKRGKKCEKNKKEQV